jgi:L-threonylcarbamoyladenylate synthase
MLTELLSTGHPEAITRAVTVLKNGGLVAIPTDTVYGVAAQVHDSQAIERIYRVKERSENKAIAVLIGEMAQLSSVAGSQTQIARRLAEAFWPGGLTLVLPRHAGLPENLSPRPTIGVRMPDHSFTRRLLTLTGPLATSSANLSGGPNPRNAQEVLAQLDGRIELVLDGGDAPGGVPSTVVDCTGDKIIILRQGAIAPEQLAKVLNNPT